ncbi:MAG: glycoside hydrolase family 2 sugar binding, partial [Mucilaginibacter sp.]|nr:glycoside hydrolase family 2 sugar binding [Mucilaginibacter sp.]
YPNYDLEYILLQLQVSYFQANKQWQQCGDIMYEILSQYGNKVDYFEGNTLIWYNVFLHAKEPKVLNEALRWLEKSLKVNQRPYMLDTYANLLYKTGQLQKALEFEQKALRCEEENGNGVKSDLLINFDKMRNQQPTWLDDTPVKVSQIKNN